jgi:hypothetical protein
MKGASGSLLSWRTCADLELLKVVKPITYQDTPTVDRPTHHQVSRLVPWTRQVERLPSSAPHQRKRTTIFQTTQTCAIPCGQTTRKKQLSQDEEVGVIERAEGPTKVQDVLNLKAPTSVSVVRSLLGMTNYCARFIEGYATLTEPQIPNT